MTGTERMIVQPRDREFLKELSLLRVADREQVKIVARFGSTTRVNTRLSVSSPTGVTTAYVYDGFGDLIQESNPNTGTAVYYYDSSGNRNKRVAATGATTQYTFDALDRVLTMTFPSDTAENVAYAYDQSGHGAGIGRLTSATDAAGTLSRRYDQLGNLVTDARTTSGASLTSAYTYDPANRIASIAYPSGATVSYTHDAMGRITSVSTKPSGGTNTPVVSNISYEPFGPYSGLTNGNGVAEWRGFDQDYRLTGIIDNGSGATLQSLAYAYYPTNNVQTMTNAIASSQTIGSTTTSYGYGTGSDQLATLSVGGVVTQAIGYTADGRIASLNPGIQAPAGQYITSLSYNQDAQLSAVNAGSGALASYTYDGFGQRLIKTVSASYGEIYQYGQDGALLEETNASGVAQADYIYLNGRPVAVLNGAALYYLHDDMLGTPQLATDSNQAVQGQASYDAFGQASVSGTVTQNLRFPGQYFDVESGWNHNGFRDYAPGLGRYIEPDPLGRLGSGNNLYAYADGNPVNLVDPLGLCAARRMSPDQCKALKVVLAREQQYGTAKAAALSSNTFGDATLSPFNSSYYPNLQTAYGQLDLDWFTDVAAFRPILNWTWVSTYDLYAAAKLDWTAARLFDGLPIGNALPFQDPGERTAYALNVLRFRYADIFTPAFMKQACGD